MDAGFEKGFVRVDVAHPRDKSLIQQQRFDPPAAAAEHSGKHSRGKILIKRIRSQRTSDGLRILHQPDSAKLAGIVEHKPAAVCECNRQPVVKFQRFHIGFHAQIAAHAQMNKKSHGIEMDLEEFSPTRHTGNLQSLNLLFEDFSRWKSHRLVP